MSVDLAGAMTLLLIPVAGFAAAIYLIFTRRRRDR
jgi:hypothetical protein